MASGPVYGFVYILAWSRYAVARFYPGQSLEFFLDGHLRAFREIGGVAHRHRYDNLRSVILRRRPEIQFNAQFLDFARHFGFTIHVCNPGKANEKGRIERLVQGVVSKTGFVEFETNRYSVPGSYAGMSCEILAFPDSLEVVVKGRKVATHRRIFERGKKQEIPGHREKLLERSPHFKLQRILALMKGMGAEVEQFLFEAEREGEDVLEAAYQMFRLLKGISKETLLSAVREANSLHVHKVFYIQSLLQPQSSPHPVCPQDQRLLEITYKDRELDDYDDLI